MRDRVHQPSHRKRRAPEELAAREVDGGNLGVGVVALKRAARARRAVGSALPRGEPDVRHVARVREGEAEGEAAYNANDA